jgi:Zn-dependent membrane protease YugP
MEGGATMTIDPIQLMLILFTFLIASLAQSAVTRAYNTFLQIPNSRSMTGAEAADRFLRENGIHDVSIEPTRGTLTDHYDPRSKVIKLSRDVYYGNSIASVSIATHEVGHAIQHAVRYPMLVFRNLMVPVTQISSSLSWILIFAGLILGFLDLALAGLVLFGVVALFQLVTLPVEFNASSRALAFLGNGVLNEEDLPGAKRVLNAAAMTYVAALVTSLLTILRFVLLIFGNSRRR